LFLLDLSQELRLGPPELLMTTFSGSSHSPFCLKLNSATCHTGFAQHYKASICERKSVIHTEGQTGKRTVTFLANSEGKFL
jgi:hypothetical protein